MKNNWEKFINAYKEASNEIKGLIDSEKIPDLLDELVFDKHVRPDDRNDIVKTISDIVLNLSTVNTLTEELKNDKKYTEENIAKIEEKITSFLAKNKLTPTTNSNPTNNGEQIQKTQGYGKFRQQMPRDDENVYTPASQDDLLKKQTTNAPSYLAEKDGTVD